MVYKSPQHRELVTTIRHRIDNGEKYLHIAIENGCSAALVSKVYRLGVDSKKLRKAMGILCPPRDRLIINGCPPELKARYDGICAGHEISRPELLKILLDDYENIPY